MDLITFSLPEYSPVSLNMFQPIFIVQCNKVQMIHVVFSPIQIPKKLIFYTFSVFIIDEVNYYKLIQIPMISTIMICLDQIVKGLQSLMRFSILNFPRIYSYKILGF